MRHKMLPLLLCLATLSACKLLKPVAPPTPAPPPASYGAKGDSTQNSALNWRQVFTDPALTALIDTALLRNIDRQMALVAIRQAEAELLRARVPLAPQVQAIVSGSAERFGDGLASAESPRVYQPVPLSPLPRLHETSAVAPAPGFRTTPLEPKHAPIAGRAAHRRSRPA